MSFLTDASLVFIPSGYKEDKAYSIKPTDGSGDLTFARASDGTRVNSDGLVERVPWNLLQQSNTFNTTWTTASTYVTSGQSDKDGGTTAWLLTKTGASGYMQQNISVVGLFTQSIYVKAGSLNWVRFTNSGISGADVYFDLANGVVGNTGGNVLEATITSVGNGWFFITVNYNGNGQAVRIFPADGNGSTSGTSGNIYIQNAQANEGTLKPYFPTTNRQDVPRLDYSNGCPCLLLEPQRTNLLTYSEQFDSSYYTKSFSTITTNSTISPDGKQNAAELVEDTSNNRHLFFNTSAISGSSSPYTVSIFLKQNTRRYAFLQIATDNASKRQTIVIDLSDGSITDTANTGSPIGVSYNVESFSNGFYRASLTATNTSGGVYIVCGLSNSATPTYNSSKEPIYTGNGSSIYCYGAMIEAGSYATSYIPTSGATATRVADAASKTGISDLIGQSEGALYWEVDFGVNDTSEYPAIFLWDGTATNRMLIQRRGNTSKLQYQVVVGGVSQVDELGTTTIGSGKVKIAYAYKANDFVVYLNGSQEIVDTSGSTYSGALSQLAFQNLRHDKTSAIALFKTRLTNDQLEVLTGNSYSTYATMASQLNYTIQ